MSRLDDELKSALRGEDPSPDFTDRLMARIAVLPANAEKQQEKTREKNGWLKKLAELLQPASMKWAMAGAMALLLMFAAVGVNRYREHQRAIIEMAEGEKAKEQVMLAMKIASAKLNAAQKKVQENSQK